MSDLTPPLDEELNQLANPTFPVMHDPKASTKGHSVFSAKGTLEYDKLDISEFAFAFLFYGNSINIAIPIMYLQRLWSTTLLSLRSQYSVKEPCAHGGHNLDHISYVVNHIAYQPSQ